MDPARLAETGRVEAFSDGVFAIVITLLVLDLRAPDSEPSGLLRDLLAQWPAYLGYLTSFLYVGVIWLNHHALFNRVQRVDKGLNLTNLTLLLTTVVLPFPTSVLATATQDGDPRNISVAVALYALVAGLMCASWLLIFSYLNRHSHLLVGVDSSFFARERLRAWTGVVGYAAAGVLGFLTPVAVPLVVLLALPVFYFLTSHGLSRWPRARAGAA
ncbi:DUF1211 domain-containing protein [Ornithinimicrobium avium]|uniref:DUF1211 domain-containing protein n=2 Tax=Ornithinimicrobium avium TaxID=2283195 RepID=A0A345NLP1_9MICO|nr:DUF1211 domain-containing protein [Ornithinimicrobium avium]